ncbi:hypothetical protein BN2127_JRS1_00942 [Bacillus cereus]|nr:hypothetical protein BN2127_JRS1_00942 [Bacillus cereus]
MITNIVANGNVVEFNKAMFEDEESNIIQIWGIPSDCFRKVFTFDLFCRRGFAMSFDIDGKTYTAEADFVRGRTTIGGANLMRFVVRDMKVA